MFAKAKKTLANKYNIGVFATLAFLLTPLTVRGETNQFLSKVNQAIINPLITILFAIALAFFILGIIEYMGGGSNDEKRAKGRDHILWALVGMGIMIAAGALMQMVLNTFGLNDESRRISDLLQQ